MAPPWNLVPRLIAGAFRQFSENGAPSALGELAGELLEAAGIALTKIAREQKDVPSAFLARLRAAQTSYEMRPDFAAGMLASIASDAYFESQSPPFRAKIWESPAGAWRKTYEETKAARAIDSFRKAVDAGDSGNSPRLPFYLYGLATCLMERSARESGKDDVSDTRLALERAIVLWHGEGTKKTACLAVLMKLCERVERDDDVAGWSPRKRLSRRTQPGLRSLAAARNTAGSSSQGLRP
jgi:hypothetical protein